MNKIKAGDWAKLNPGTIWLSKDTEEKYECIYRDDKEIIFLVPNGHRICQKDIDTAIIGNGLFGPNPSLEKAWKRIYNENKGYWAVPVCREIDAICQIFSNSSEDNTEEDRGGLKYL